MLRPAAMVSLAALALVALVAAAPSTGSDRGPVSASASTHGSSGCPPRKVGERTIAARNRNPKSRRTLVPTGPRTLLLCRYNGLANSGTPKSEALKLAGSRLLGRRSAVRNLARAFRRLAPVGNGIYNCPADFGARLYAIFRYPHAPRAFLQVNLSGCRFVANGRAQSRWLTPRLQRRLEALTGAGG